MTGVDDSPTRGKRSSFSSQHLVSVETRKKKEKTMGAETFLEVILAILLPPVGVFLRYGCGIEFWIDLLLTILGYIPGIIYALYVLVG
ncbi:hypothetical protein MLD38_002592 [Melastoma candidum]|uniref:Uncharacterized protein n=1 Tax=Melastoma candidum TaxID=119954 RepID=A0ACB9RZH1_9MYRT|nr:hypothetical protein MLD38_002592 [Melastoma candidum]